MNTRETSRKENTESIMDGMQALRRKMMAGYLKHSKLGAVDITPSQLAVISIVMEKEKLQNRVGLKIVAETLGITSSAATQLVESLVKKGYLVKQSDAKDRRALFLEIPPKFKRKMTAMKAKVAARFTKMFDALNDKELALYAKLNEKIVRNILNKK